MTEYAYTYVAGPMTGYPDWNQPAFMDMAARLRAVGHQVINPAELHEASSEVPWDWYLRRDLAELVKCSQVVMLQGWERSKGARLGANETIHTSTTGAKKAGNDERYDLIPAEPLRMLARHYGVGAKKYDDDNWRKGYDWRLSFAAMMRHAWQFWAGEDIDEETGTPHIIAVAWHSFTLAEFMAIHPEFDTRLKSLAQRAVQAYENP